MFDVLKAAGVPVAQAPGWQARGHGEMSGCTGVLGHHTAGPARGNAPSYGVVLNGRPGLAGPLANLFLARDGTWTCIAAGAGWHAGTGGLPWVPANQGNQYLIGIEAESSGVLQNGQADWTAEQLDSYPRGVAALLQHIGHDADRFAGHKEYTTRKPDPANWPGGMAGFRGTVAQHLAGAPTTAAPRKTTHLEMVDMLVGQDQTDGRLYLVSGNSALEFPQGGGDPKGRGHGNLYADILLDMLDQAYPDGPKAQLVALNHDVVTRIPPAWSFIDGSAAGTTKTTPGEQVARG
jgi:hypothetical protein